MDGQPSSRTARSARRLAAVLAALGLVAAWLVLPAVAASAASNLQICDKTGSNSNPYVQHGVDTSSANLSGHSGHTGPVWTPTLPAGTVWGDIIPAYDLTQPSGTVAHDGLNWDAAGQAIWNNGCNVTTVTPGAVTAHQATCTTAATYSIVTTPGVVYKLGSTSGTTLTNGTPAALPLPLSVTVYAVPASAAYVLTGTTSWPLTFNVPTGTGCPQTLTPGAVTAHQATCASPNSASYTIVTTAGVAYHLGSTTGALVANGDSATVPSTVTVYAVPVDPNDSLTGTTSWPLTFTVPTGPGCPQTLTPGAVTANQATCASPTVASYHIVTTPGVAYHLGSTTGAPVVDGDSATVPSTVTVYAVSTVANTSLTGTTSWPLTFAAPTGCPQTLTPGAVTAKQATCTTGASYVIATTPGVVYKLGSTTGATVADGDPAGVPSTITVFAVPADPKDSLTGTTSWPLAFATPTGCPGGFALATAVRPAVTPSSCSGTTPAVPSYTVPTTSGVIYSVTGVGPVNGGTVRSGVASSETLTAVAAAGYALTNPGFSEVLVFGPLATGCNPPAPTTDLGIVKLGPATAVQPGDDVSYTLTVTNTGTGDATNVVITDVLPAGLTFVSSTGAACTGPTTITCALGTVTAGGNTVITVVTKLADPYAATTVVNTATVGPVDAHPDNNTSTATTQVVQPIQGGTDGEETGSTPTPTPTPEPTKTVTAVTPEQPVIASGPKLPFTGSYTDRALSAGVLLLIVGLLLALVGRRRRTA